MSNTTQWMNKAAQYELLALAFAYPSEETTHALVSGEYAEAFEEIGALTDASPGYLADWAKALRAYAGLDRNEVLHRLRREYTRLFIGQGKTLISPYAGVWDALERGKEPILMIGAESMEIERFMRRCGIGQPEGTNEPLDHIASLLEFLYFLCLVKADAVKPANHADVRDDDYQAFFDDHFEVFSRAFANAVLENAKEPFFVSSARMLLDLKR